MKILSIHDLATIRKRAEHNLSLREESNEKGLHHQTSRLIALGVLILAWLMSVEYYWFCNEYRLIIHLNSNDKISLASEYQFHQYWLYQSIVASYLLLGVGVSHLLRRKRVINEA